MAEAWRVFKLNFEVFATAIELKKKKEEVKIAVFLNALGTDAIELFETLEITAEDKKIYAKVVEAFAEFCEPQKMRYTRHFCFMAEINFRKNHLTHFIWK